jgi:hypothetical protein
MDQHDVSDGGATVRSEAFRDAQLPRVRAYVAVVCAPERSEDAESAVLVDFLARAGGEPAPAELLERELLRATRSGAAGRFNVLVPAGRPELHLTAECRAMPELLALHANGERPEDESLIARHLAGCPVCAHTLDRMREAERAFARGAGELPELEIEETSVETRNVVAAPPPRAVSNPIPEPKASLVPTQLAESPIAPGAPAAPPAPAEPHRAPTGAPAAHRRRSGGLVGAIRKLARPTGP